jgi:hypothetical protein
MDSMVLESIQSQKYQKISGESTENQQESSKWGKYQMVILAMLVTIKTMLLAYLTILCITPLRISMEVVNQCTKSVIDITKRNLNSRT